MSEDKTSLEKCQITESDKIWIVCQRVTNETIKGYCLIIQVFSTQAKAQELVATNRFTLENYYIEEKKID